MSLRIAGWPRPLARGRGRLAAGVHANPTTGRDFRRRGRTGHRSHGALAPNARLRSAVVVLGRPETEPQDGAPPSGASTASGPARGVRRLSDAPPRGRGSSVSPQAATGLPAGHPFVEASRLAEAPEPSADVQAGDSVGWSGGTLMQDFTSSTLGRTFPEILFVHAVSVLRSGDERTIVLGRMGFFPTPIPSASLRRIPDSGATLHHRSRRAEPGSCPAPMRPAKRPSHEQPLSRAHPS